MFSRKVETTRCYSIYLRWELPLFVCAKLLVVSYRDNPRVKADNGNCYLNLSNAQSKSSFYILEIELETRLDAKSSLLDDTEQFQPHSIQFPVAINQTEWKWKFEINWMYFVFCVYICLVVIIFADNLTQYWKFSDILVGIVCLTSFNDVY